MTVLSSASPAKRSQPLRILHRRLAAPLWIEDTSARMPTATAQGPVVVLVLDPRPHRQLSAHGPWSLRQAEHPCRALSRQVRHEGADEIRRQTRLPVRRYPGRRRARERRSPPLKDLIEGGSASPRTKIADQCCLAGRSSPSPSPRSPQPTWCRRSGTCSLATGREPWRGIVAKVRGARSPGYDTLSKRLRQNGPYEQVAPSIIQPADIFLDQIGEAIRGRTYVFTDLAGEELCLRPDLTVPGVAALSERHPRPMPKPRYCYNGPAFRFQPGVQAIGTRAKSDRLGSNVLACRPRQRRRRNRPACGRGRSRGRAQTVRFRFGDIALFYALIEALRCRSAGV